MKKNEYTSPEMEIVEITEKYTLLGDSTVNGKNPNPGFGSRKYDDED